jgi:hypothetical protein
MKKTLCLCFSTLLLFGCAKEGRSVKYEIDKGDMKLTITKDYIIVDSCSFINGFGQTVWEFNKTISKSDSTACHELLERLLVK